MWNYFNGIFHFRLNEPKLNCGAWEEEPITTTTTTTTATKTSPKPNGSTPILSAKFNNHNNKNHNSAPLKSANKTPSSPSPIKRSDPLSTLTVAAAAAASSLRHSFNVTTGHHNNHYDLNHPTPPVPGALKGSFKGRGNRHSNNNNTGRNHNNNSNKQKSNGNENCCSNISTNHGRFQRTLSLDGHYPHPYYHQPEEEELVALSTVQEKKSQMPQGGVGGGKNGSSSGGGSTTTTTTGKNKRMMFSGSKFSQNSLSFDMRDSCVHLEATAAAAAAARAGMLKKSHSDHESAGENELGEEEDEVVLRKKLPTNNLSMDCDECDGVSRTGSEFSDHRSSTGILSTLISSSQRNSQLRSTLSKARHHLSFEKWRSSSSHSHQYQPTTSPVQQQQQSNQSATPNSQHPQDCNSANHSYLSSSSCNNNNNSSCNSSNNSTAPTPNESPGGRLSRWFSIRRGSSHHYDLNGSAGGGGGSGNRDGGGNTGGCGSRDVRDGPSGGSSRLNSINNEYELAEQIQQQLHQSLSKVISQANGLQQLQQQSAVITSSSMGNNNARSEKMPLVAEHEEESYNAFGLGMSYRTTSTLKAPGASLNGSQLLTPMPTVAPAGLSQQQLKRRHIVAAIAHSEISYVATLSRLVNDYKKPLEDGLPAPLLSSTKIGTLFYRLPEIYHCHSLFRIGLMDAVRNWDAEEKIGDVFMAAFSKPVVLDLYSGFINNFSVAMELAKMETKRKSALADFFRLQQMNAHDRLSFFGLMVKPVQRFPQFILFLQDLLKYTPHGHHDRMSLQLALTQLESLAETLNERKREAEQYQAFKEMLSHISGTFNTRFLSSSSDGNKNRYLIREDDVTQLEFNPAGMVVKSKRRRLLLLNDKVICVSVAPKQSSDFGATEKLSFKWMYPVADVEILDNNTSVTLSRILTAGLNRGGSLKANTSAPNLQGHFGSSGTGAGASVSGNGGSVSESTSPVAGSAAVHGADNLCTEMSNLMHDYEVVSRINELIGAFKGTYKELNCDVTKKMLAGIQASIQKKDEEMAWLDSCCLQLTVKTKSGKEETYTFQTDNPNIKKEWVTELRLAQLALNTNNSPAWDVSDQQHVQRPLTKMPLFVKAQVVRKAQHQTEVRCGCYYTITNSRTSGKASSRGGRKATTQNYVWICTTDSSSSHITVFSFQHQQAGVLEELFSFEIAETIVTTIEFVKGTAAAVHVLEDKESAANLITGDTVWMGTDTKKVLVYPANCGEMFSMGKNRPTMVDVTAHIQQLTSYSAPGPIAQIAYHPEGVFLTTRTGSLVIFRKRSNSGAWNLDQPQIVSVMGNNESPGTEMISRLLPINNNVYVACGRRINVLASHSADFVKTFDVEADEGAKIHLMTHSGIGLWVSMHQSSVISLYHTETLKHLQDINIAANVLRLTSSQFKGDAAANNNNKSSIHVTALTASRGLLWVGTNVGIALTIPLPRLEGAPIIAGGISISYHAHFGSITFLLPLIPKSYHSGPVLNGHPSVLPKASPSPVTNTTTTTTIAEEGALKISEEKISALPQNAPSLKVIKVSPSNSTVSSSSNSSDGSASSSHQPVMMTRRRTLEKQHSIDSPFSAAISSKFRAQLASSPIVLRRQRFKDSDSIRMSQTLPRSLGSSSLSSSSSAGYFSQSIHSNASSSASSEQNCCDVYGLYGDLIFVKEDYEAEDGAGNMLDGGGYENLRRSNPELIPVKVSTLDRRMRMKVSRPRSLDLSNWSVDSRSSSLYTSSGSEESMALRMLQNGTVSRNNSSASRKFNEQLLPQVIAELPSPTGTAAMTGAMGTTGGGGGGGGGGRVRAAIDSDLTAVVQPNIAQSSDHLMAGTTATLRRKGAGAAKAAKGQQQLPEIAGKRTIITLTGGRGYINWRHIWCNNAAGGGGIGGVGGGSVGNSGSSLTVSHCENKQRSGSVPNVPAYPRIPNSTDPHVVIWEKKL